MLTNIRKYKIHIFLSMLVLKVLIISKDEYNNCKTKSGKIVYLIHHITSLYLYLGWIIFDNRIHLLVCIIVFLHWIVSEKCILTVITNKLCDYSQNNKFDDLLYYTNLVKYNKHIHYIVLSVIIVINVLLIINLKY